MSGQPTSSNENFDSVVPSFDGDIEPFGSSLSTASSSLAIAANLTSIFAAIAQACASQAEIQRIQEDAKAHRQKVEAEVEAYSKKLDRQSDGITKFLKDLTESNEKQVQTHSKKIDNEIENQKKILDDIYSRILEIKDICPPEVLIKMWENFTNAQAAFAKIDTRPLQSINISGLLKDFMSSTSFSDKQARSTGQKSANTVDVDADEV